jgi:hypothetical protein
MTECAQERGHRLYAVRSSLWFCPNPPERLKITRELLCCVYCLQPAMKSQSIRKL